MSASPAAGWRCVAPRLPTFPPPALRGEPTGRAARAPVRTRRAAFHRGRWRQRDGRGGGAEQGARRCRRRPCSPPAEVPRGLSCVRSALAAWGTGLGGARRATNGAPLPGGLFAKVDAAPSCRALRAAVTRLDPESAWGLEQAPSRWTLLHWKSGSGSQDPSC